MYARFLACAGAVFLFCALPRDASAGAREGSPPGASNERRDPTWIASADVLGALIGRFGVEVQYLARPQDGFVFYPWVLESNDSGSPGLFDGDPDFSYPTRTTAEGLDLQYRHYFGSSGARGFFVAPGLEVQHFATETAATCVPGAYEYNHPGGETCAPPVATDQDFTYLGVSVDMGGQAVFRSGLMIALSVGAHYRSALGSLVGTQPFEWELTEGPGLRPRLRLSAGWAWF
jgi:hypothetical protein